MDWKHTTYQVNTQVMTKHNLPDIDIDFADRDKAVKLLGGTPASIIRDGKVTKHNTGMYYTRIPVDPLTGTASLDHKAAEDRGYFKLDFLNLGIYDNVRDEEHLVELINREPNWKRLTHDMAFVSDLIHVGNYFDLLKSMKPQTLEQMAMFLAIIRPGKRHLQNKPWDEVALDVWEKHEDEGYTFKKSHATSYAMAVIVHMNLIEEMEDEVRD